MDTEPSQQRATGLRLAGEFDGVVYDFALRLGDSRLGAADSNELVIPVAEVSREHAVIHVDEEGARVEDLGSKNGTFINGGRVTQGRLENGDLVCFGVVVLRFVASDSGDSHLAISFDEAPGARVKRPQRWAKTQTPAGCGVSVPERWLRVADRASAELGADPTAVPLALEIVMTGVGADGAALLAWHADEDPVVEHTCGAWRSHDGVPRLQEKANVGSSGSGDPEELFITLDGSQPLAAAVSYREKATACALVMAGQFPQREACGALLELVLHLLERSGGRTERPTESRRRRPVPDLVFPAGYVPGRSDVMRSVYHQLRALLKGDLRVLITGETGVGKEHIARILHASSTRASGPFEAVNCAAIPTDLLEVELFGIEAGVATGVSAHVGKMVAARGGVVFLDEIGDMSPALQAKLLRVLEESAAHPVGARRPIPLDVRIISATNFDLRARIKEGRFRPDLYYRIAGYTLEIPPLRQRREDIPALVEHFIREFAAEVETSVRGISARALRALEEAEWAGNVRELASAVKRLVYLCPNGRAITSGLLSPGLLACAQHAHASVTESEADLSEPRHKDELDRQLIQEALSRAGGNKAAAARLLQLSSLGLRKMMRRLGIET
jgi:DNA-binding NtrC family response regulator